MDDQDLIDELQRAEAALRLAQAVRAAAVQSVYDRVEAMGYLISGAIDTVAAVTTSSHRSASHLTEASLTVCERPRVWQALAIGEVDLTRARIVASGLAEVPDPHREDLELKALAYAAEHTAYLTRRYVTRLLVDFNPQLAQDERERKRKKAWDDRHIGVFARNDGMADIYGCLPTGTAMLMMDALDETARKYDDDRTMDQKRVDALAQILQEIVHLDIHVDVVIPADTLAGLQDGGASVEGFGPVDAEFARGLALSEDARWRRLISDPVTGRLLDLSTTAYRIPDAIKRGVRARDRVCRFPGCAAQARHTDTDHVVPWPQGATEVANLAASCRHHHRVKTHSGWTVEMDDEAVLTWISPLGSRHRSEPWDYLDPPA